MAPIEDNLRSRAEQAIKQEDKSATHLKTESDDLALLHELQVHQIELEMQNDELRRAQVELTSAEAKYRELYDFAPVGYLTLDAADRILDVNFSGASLLGVARGDLINRCFLTFLSSQSQSEYRQFVQRLKNTGDRQTCEFGLMREDGAIRFLHAEGLATEQVDNRRVRLAILDITERRRVEHLSQERSQQFRSNFENVFDEGPLGIAFVDLDSRFLHANKQFCDMVGYSVEELLTMHTADIVHREDISISKENALKQLEGGPAILARETRYDRKNGDVFWARTLVTLMRDSQNNPVQFLKMIEDISEQKMSEKTRLAAILQERTRMAHDIHDTLAQGFTGILMQLQAAAYAPEQQQARVHIAQASDLARQSLQEARRSVRALRPLAFDSGGENIAGALKQLVSQVGSTTSMRVQLQIQGVPYSLPTDMEDHMFRIGQEAITNAFKHSMAGEIQVELSFEPTHVKLCVRDDGNGFDAKAGFQGSGFGLIGMSERAGQIGANMTLASSPGHGTAITVSVDVVPLAADKGGL